MTESVKTTYKTLSSKVRSLLQGEEGFDVEFKESIASLSNEDLVAFANSPRAGTILIGVKEKKQDGGRSYGIIKGCSVGEESKRKILNKAESCVPPIDVMVIEENTTRTPFYRIEISSGVDKPYSTSGGTYKIREDGKNKALLAGSLLSLFLSKEQDRFVARFRQATDALSKSVGEVRQQLLEELEQIDSALEEIFGSAVNAQDDASEAMGFADETLGTVQHNAERINDLEGLLDICDSNLISLLNHFDLEDERSIRQRRMLLMHARSMIRRQLRENPKLSKTKIISQIQKEYPGLTDSDYTDIFDEVKSAPNKDKY